MFGEEHSNTIKSMGLVASLLRDQGNTTEAEQAYREALEISRRRLGEKHPDTLNFTICLGGLLNASGKHAEAEALLAGVESDVRAGYAGGEPYRPGMLLMCLGEARTALAKDAAAFAAAEANLLEAHGILAKTLSEKHSETRYCVKDLAELYSSMDKSEPGKGYDGKAAQWKAKAEATQPPATFPQDTG